jgi:guanylate kinase
VSRFLVILTSPSGGGKTTIAHRLLATREDVGFSISATTRPARESERDGTDYHFLTAEEFARRRDAGAFLEWAEYGGHLYGTLEAEVDRVLAGGRHVVLDIEIQGAAQIRQRRSDVVSIFILPPSADVLIQRLTERASDDQESLARRLTQAGIELQQAEHYDYVVVNDDLEQAVAEVAAIVDAETHRTMRQDELLQTVARLRSDLERQTNELTG